MSGRYVLVEFDDKDAAIKLKKQIDKASRAGRPFRVVGYFLKPDAPYCLCGREVEETNKPISLARNHKYGVSKCTECGLYSSRVDPRNQLTPEKIINPPVFKGIHYRTKEVVEWVHYFLTVSAVARLVPIKEKDNG